MTFLTSVFALLSILGALFVLHGVAILVRGRKLGHGNVFNGISQLVMFYGGCKVSSLGIKTLGDHHGIMCSRSFVCEQIQDIGFVQLLIAVKQGWHMCHS